MSDEMMMIPVSFSSMVTNNGYDAGFASSSGFSVAQPNGEGGPHPLPEILSNTSEGLMQLSTKANSGNNDDDEDNSVNDEGANQQSSKRSKPYHRHTQHQIQELEAFFKECPHPTDKHRKELGRRLGLEPLQIKFWFQNKRTQVKTHNEREENETLRAEAQMLRAENARLRQELGDFTCPHCNGPLIIGEAPFDVNEARMEYARLKAELDRVSLIAAKYVGEPPFTTFNVCSPPPTPGAGSQHFGAPTSAGQSADNVGEAYGSGGETPRSMNYCPAEANKSVVADLAAAAMEELVEMATMKEPLWVPSIDATTTLLDQDEYFRLFSTGFSPKPQGYKTEASRETEIVIINHLHLVETLMNVSHWAAMFSSIVSRAVTVDVLSTGHQAGSYDGALLLIYAEFQVPTPHVPTRYCYFIRYCKNLEGTWAVVDVSLDHINPVGLCRKRPSGCIIKEVPNGYTKVTWVEHVEVEDNEVHSNIYKPLVDSCIAFGAKRWVATLDRQCERMACTMATNISPTDNLAIASPQSRKSILKLAERMVISFCSGVSSSTAHEWTVLSGTGSDDVRIMIRKSVDDPGRPSGLVLSASTSLWLPTEPKRVFDFLRTEHSRSEWDILSNSGIVTEMAHIANGRETGNCVSLLRVNSGDWNQSNMLILQESSTDTTASFVIYAPVDIVAMNSIIGGGDPEYVGLLPSGFAILPDGPLAGTSCGSLLTISFQILVDSVPTAKLSAGSVATVNELIHCTAERIKASLSDVLGTYGFQ
ncbi:homeobox-leucine zipper protein HDG2-like [Ipomoea triloba]|uniref:homeobox-leucine zipper protein HDG2-like n=1 Tax=Ipomoea triloba TaxID=35885 RepID=UPI00125D88E8|nr:homeobox-leucine zipper protein HDG2-like [Ipomoea triloba]XP_031102997.1 homeobox-leucine zipper protein HDG2-like [Ipomoea triloba]